MLTYSKITNNEYVKAVVNSWGFDYDNGSDIIGECIRRDDYFYENLEKYCNTKMNIVRTDHIGEVIDRIVDNLAKDIPTMIHFDTFFAYWNGFYQKEHYRHVVLAVDCDMNRGIIKVIDADIKNEEFEVSFEELKKACEFYVEYTITSDDKECDILEQLSEKINHDTLVRQDMFDDMLNSKFVLEFRNIMKGRVLFIHYLRNIEQKYKRDLSQVICPLSVALSKWNNIINLLVKNFCMNWRGNIGSKIAKMLLLIADIEKSAYNNLIKIMAPERENTIHKVDEKMCQYKSIAFDISRYVNNKGFGYTKDDIDSDYTGIGEFIVLNKEYEKGIYIKEKQVSFELCLGAEFDNVICE